MRNLKVDGIYDIFGSSKKFKLLEHKHIMHDFEAGDLEIPNIYFFARNSNFVVLRKH